MFTSRRRAIKIYVYRNANSNVNQEAAKLLISRGNFLHAATRRDVTDRRRYTTCMFACVQTGPLPSVFRPMIYARGRSCRTLMSLVRGPATGRIVPPLERLTGPHDWKITAFSALVVDANGMKNYCGCRSIGKRPRSTRAEFSVIYQNRSCVAD